MQVFGEFLHDLASGVVLFASLPAHVVLLAWGWVMEHFTADLEDL